jgi:hypothetical protein
MEVFINRQTIGLLHFLPIPTSELDALSSEFQDFGLAFARRPQSSQALPSNPSYYFLFASRLNNDI